MIPTLPPLRFSEGGILVLKGLESFRPFVYDDATGHALAPTQIPIGKATIGYGHELSPTENYPNGITKTQGENLLRTDILEAEIEVRDWLDANKVPVTQNQFDALVMFIFNDGPKPLHAGFGELLRKHQYQAAADRMLEYDKSDKNGILVVNNGLIARQQTLRALFLKR